MSKLVWKEGMVFKTNTPVHIDGETEWFYPGDIVPKGLDLSNMNADCFSVPSDEGPVEYFDDYESMRVVQLLEAAKDKGLDIELTNKKQIIEVLREYDLGARNADDLG